MNALRLLRIAFLLVLTTTSTLTLSGQNRFLRGLEENINTQKWEFVSINMDDGLTTVLSQLPDTLVPWGNGTVTAFNVVNQEYYYIAETPVTMTRYLVTLNAFSGRVIQAVQAPGIFAIYPNTINGFVYGIRYITVTQLVKISPSNGATTAITIGFNFVYSYSSAGSSLYDLNNEFWVVGEQPLNNDVIARVNLSSAGVQSTNISCRLVRHDPIDSSVYAIRQIFNPTRFELLELSSADPSQETTIEDSLHFQTLNGEVAMVNPYLKEMYVKVLIPTSTDPQMAMLKLNDGQVFKYLPLPGTKNGLVFTSFPPNLRTHTLSGLAYLDRNANGVPDANDIGIANQRINVQPGGYTLLTNQSGRYSLQVPDGAYTITPFPTPLYYVSSLPLSYQVAFQSGINLADTLDFGFSINPGQPKDSITVSVSPSRARVGTDSQHTITIRNDGNTVLDGTVTYQEGEHMTVSSSSEPPSSVNNGTYTFNFSNLLPGEVR